MTPSELIDTPAYMKSCLILTTALADIIARNKVRAQFNDEQSKAAAEALKIWEAQARENAKLIAAKTKEFQDERKPYNCLSVKTASGIQSIAGCNEPAIHNLCGSAGWYVNIPDDCQANCIVQGTTNQVSNYKRSIICRRSKQQIEDDVNEWKSIEIVTEPKPVNKEGIYYHVEMEDLPASSINCCLNYMDIKAENVANNIQYCQQLIQNRIEEQTGTTQKPQTVPTTSPPPPTTTTTTFPPAQIQMSYTPTQTSKIKEEYIVLVILILVLFLFTIVGFYFFK